MKDRRDKSLYFYCGDKWTPRHKYQSSKLYLLEEVLLENGGWETQGEESGKKEEEAIITKLEINQQDPEISLHALTRSFNSKAI